MMNPIQVFFGRDALSSLRGKPSALRRVSDAVKPLLMGVVHPDRDPTLGGVTAAEISEAHLRLKTASPDEIEAWVSEFLAKDRDERLKLELREARQEIRRLKEQLKAQTMNVPARPPSPRHRRISTQTDESLRKAMWNWIIASIAKVPQVRRIERVNRGALYRFRVVVQYQDGYRAYEFNMEGQVRRTIFSISRNEAATAFLFRGDTSRKMTYLDKRFNDDLLIGSAPIQPKDLGAELAAGTISPIVSVGQTPVFIGGLMMTMPFNVIESDIRGGTIVELVSIRRARAELKDAASPPTARMRRIERLARKEEARRQAKMKKEERERK